MLCEENERFKEFFGGLKMSQKIFADSIKKSSSNVNAWLNDRTHITGESMVAILRAYPNLDARWFLFGKERLNNGTNLVEEPLEHYKQLNPNEMNTLIQELSRQLKQKDEQINFLQEEIKYLRGNNGVGYSKQSGL